MPIDWGDERSAAEQALTLRARPSDTVTGDGTGQALPEIDGTDRTDGPEPPTMMRFNSGKRKLHLVPPSLSHYTAAVLEYGAIKYSANNWRKGGSWNEVYNSFQRHMDAFREGEDFDAESGLPHLCHAAFNLMVLIEFFDKGIGTDDRFNYTLQDRGTRLTGRLLEFREPPRKPDAA